MSIINTDLLLNLSQKYTFNMSKDDLHLSLRRIKRIFDIDDFSPDHFNNHEDIIDYLLHKYSIPTIIHTVQTIIIISQYYCEHQQVLSYGEHLASIIDMKTNADLYTKVNISDIESFINNNYLRFLKGNVCFSKFRHFTLLTLIIREIPLRYQTLTNIKYVYHNWVEKEDCLEHTAYLLKKKDTFLFIFNKKEQNKITQTEYQIEDSKLRMLLLQYFSTYANNLNYLFTTSGGKKCSESNLANALSNFCRLYLTIPLTLGELRNEWIKYPRSAKQKYIFNNF
jgi:hypothetical protein